MYRTEKGLGWIKRLSEKKFWEHYEKISFYLGIFMIIISFLLVLYGIIKVQPSFVPLIPGTEIKGIQIPLFETIIAIFITAFIHEISHAILLFKNNLSVKNWGFFFLGPFLGAFVEPNEDELKDYNEKKKISIFSAGSSTNLIFGGILFIIVFILLSILPNVGKSYLIITGTIPNTSAYYLNISPGEKIISINGIEVKTIKELNNILSRYKPGDTVLLETNKSVYNITLIEKNGKAIMGVYLVQVYETRLNYLIYLLGWIGMINIGIGIANMLPIYPLDGGRALESLLRLRFNKERSRKITIYISALTILLILINISFLFI